MDITIPDANLLGVLKNKISEYQPPKSQEDLVNEALDNPIGSPRLEELVAGKKDVVIITSDHTRPVPSRITMPILLKRIRAANPQIDIKILIATGFHRASTKDELIDKFGEEIVSKEKIIIHDSRDKESMVKVGVLPSGGDLYLNRVAIETDLLIAEGFIEPHFFAGFSGGRKSVLPGIAAAESIKSNHCAQQIAHPCSRTGILKDNPIHQDMLYAAQQAKLAFILNVVINKKKEIIKAFAGDSVQAHEEGCRYVNELSRVEKIPADIVVVTNGGYPLDQNVYQAVKGMTAAEATCKENGVIIMIAACNDGHGGESFYENLRQAKSPQELLDRINKIKQEDTLSDQWEFQILARVLSKHTVIMVTDMCDPKLIEDMHMKHAGSFKEALDMAFELKGKDAKVVVIEDGVSTIVI